MVTRIWPSFRMCVFQSLSQRQIEKVLSINAIIYPWAEIFEWVTISGIHYHYQTPKSQGVPKKRVIRFYFHWTGSISHHFIGKSSWVFLCHCHGGSRLSCWKDKIQLPQNLYRNIFLLHLWSQFSLFILASRNKGNWYYRTVGLIAKGLISLVGSF